MAIGALTNPTYKPAMRTITSITRSFPALVTTSFAHGYHNGLKARIYVPYSNGITDVDGVPIYGFGMEQINGRKGTITITDDPTTFYIDIDTTYFDPFVLPPNQDPPDTQVQQAQVVPAGYTSNVTQNAWLNVL